MDHCTHRIEATRRRETEGRRWSSSARKEAAMTWSRVATYKVKPDTMDDVVRKARQELLPVLQRQPEY